MAMRVIDLTSAPNGAGEPGPHPTSAAAPRVLIQRCWSLFARCGARPVARWLGEPDQGATQLVLTISTNLKLPVCPRRFCCCARSDKR